MRFTAIKVEEEAALIPIKTQITTMEVVAPNINNNINSIT
jgi:hypothetical protein